MDPTGGLTARRSPSSCSPFSSLDSPFSAQPPPVSAITFSPHLRRGLRHPDHVLRLAAGADPAQHIARLVEGFHLAQLSKPSSAFSARTVIFFFGG
jgi:hypothetical protein